MHAPNELNGKGVIDDDSQLLTFMVVLNLYFASERKPL